MSSAFPLFDRSRLSLKPLRERRHDLDLGVIRPLRPAADIQPGLERVAAAMLRARERGAAVIFMMGAHVIRSGVQRYLIDLMERGLITGLAGNGACAVHDFELALIGATTESVATYIQTGQFGLWAELEALNRALAEGVKEGRGAGEALGRLIEDGDFPHKEISLLGRAWRLKIPFTLHIGIGCDIVHELPGCDGAALGAASHTDFLIFAQEMSALEGGVFANFGSAVTGPEVYLKALAMARNAAGPGAGPRQFTTLVCDLLDLPDDTGREPDRADPRYYYRPWKTILARSLDHAPNGATRRRKASWPESAVRELASTAANHGESHYVKGRHEQTIPALWTALGEIERGGDY